MPGWAGSWEPESGRGPGVGSAGPRGPFRFQSLPHGGDSPRLSCPLRRGETEAGMGGQGNRLPELGLCQSTQAAPSGSRLSNRVPPEALGGQPVPAAWAGGGGTPRAGPLTKASAAGRTGSRRGREGGPTGRGSLARGGARSAQTQALQPHGLKHGPQLWAARAQMPASLLCGREQRLGFSVPQLLHPEKVLTSVPAFRGRWEEERGSCSLARAPTHGKPPCEFPAL